jgi:hypothetical protein
MDYDKQREKELNNPWLMQGDVDSLNAKGV